MSRSVCITDHLGMYGTAQVPGKSASRKQTFRWIASMRLETGAAFDRMIVLSLSLGGTRNQIRNLTRKEFRWAVWIKRKTLRQQLWHGGWEEGAHGTPEDRRRRRQGAGEGGPWCRKLSPTLSATSGLIIQGLLVWVVEETPPKFIFAIKKVDWKSFHSHYSPGCPPWWMAIKATLPSKAETNRPDKREVT